MLKYSLAFSIAFVVSLILTPLVKRAAHRLSLFDAPNYRKIHNSKVPRLGGIAIYASFMIVFYSAVFWGYLELDWHRIPKHFLQGYAIGGALILILGVWDDVRTLRPIVKLVLQIVASAVTIAFGLVIRKLSLPYIGDIDLGIMAAPFTLFWIVGVTNAINLIDGLDGLAAGVTFIASMTLFLISLTQGKPETALFSVVLAGSIVGFLRYNFNPAQIFLGDSGALFLGYSLANFSVLGSLKASTAVALLIPIIALGFPIMDTLLAMIRRYGRALKNGKGPISAFREIGAADREHVHHKLMELGYTHKKTVIILYGLCVLFGLFAFTLTAFRDQSAATILFFVALLVFVIVRVLGYVEFRGLKEGNFLEQYISKLNKNVKQKHNSPDSEEKDGK